MLLDAIRSLQEQVAHNTEAIRALQEQVARHSEVIERHSAGIEELARSIQALGARWGHLSRRVLQGGHKGSRRTLLRQEGEALDLL